MSLFGSKKKTYVSSVAYNLAGDPEGRPDYLKTLVVGNVISNTQDSMGESIKNGYLNGPGIKLRSYYRWAQDDYSSIMGVSSGGLRDSPDLDHEVLKNHIPLGSGAEISIQRAQLSLADYEFWAEDWMLKNYPTEYSSAWVSNYDDATGEVVITRSGGSQHRFVPFNFAKISLYILAGYNEVTGSQTGPVVGGELIDLGSGGSFPGTSGWTQESLATQVYNPTLNKKTEKTITYSDGRPAEESELIEPTVSEYTDFQGFWTREQYHGRSFGSDGSERLIRIKYYMYQNQAGSVVPVFTTSTVVEDIGGGVTKTTVTDITQDTIVFSKTTKTDTQETAIKTWSPLKIFIYRIGDGNAVLDAMVTSPGDVSGYLPPIPIRLNNNFVSDTHYTTEYAIAKRAYRKLTGGKFDDLVETLADNPDLADLDFIYAVPGVSINGTENAGRKYIYEFLHQAMASTTSGYAEYEAWGYQQALVDDAANDWVVWNEAQSNPGNPLFGSPEPTRSAYYAGPRQEVRVSTAGNANVGFDMRISWLSIKEETGAGLAKAGAKPGELWFAKGVSSEFNAKIWGGILGSLVAELENDEEIFLYWQLTSNSWKRLVVRGLLHRNYVYNGKFVETYAHEALDDADDSGFIFPIHYDTWREMSLIDTTQMATACLFLVINSYQVVKKKWYQTWIFKIFLFIVAVVVTFYAGPAGGAGVLGFSASVGAALGFTGLAAAIIGAIVNTLAAMMIMRIITEASMALLGDKLGVIVAVVASMIALQAGTAFSTGQSMAVNWHSLTDVKNILSATNALGQGVAGYIQGSIQETLAESQRLLENYNTEAKGISDLYAQNIGYGRGIIDPMGLTDVGSFLVERSDTFLYRTLMTGSDVAELSMSLLTNFSDLTLNVEPTI